jgi:hypothetical protein
VAQADTESPIIFINWRRNVLHAVIGLLFFLLLNTGASVSYFKVTFSVISTLQIASSCVS